MHGPTMTIGELARRTGVSAKVLRRHHDMGLIYSRGRSPTGYRLFDDDALWCVTLIRELRTLGLTEAEIQRFAQSVDRTGGDCGLMGQHLAELLCRSRARIESRINALEQQRQRIDEFENRYRATHAGRSTSAGPWGPDPRNGRVTS